MYTMIINVLFTWLFVVSIPSLLQAGGIGSQTQVQTLCGMIPAEKLVPGMQVRCWDFATQKLVHKPIIHKSFQKRHTYYRLKVTGTDRKGVEQTVTLIGVPDQMTYSPSRKSWVRLCDLDPDNDTISINYYQEAPIDSLEYRQAHLSRCPRAMYFFEVQDCGMFYATPLLIPLHNTAFLVVPPMVQLGFWALRVAATVADAMLRAVVMDALLGISPAWLKGEQETPQQNPGQEPPQMPENGGDPNGNNNNQYDPKEVAAGQQRVNDLKKNELRTSVAKHEKPANSMVGRKGADLGNSVLDSNQPATIRGQEYTGHAVDRMQGRGIPPSAVEEAIANGIESVGKKPNTTHYYDPVNDITVVTNEQSGAVVTLHYGG